MNEKLESTVRTDGIFALEWLPILWRLLLLTVCLMFSQGAIAFSAACNDNIKAMCGDVVPGAYRLTSCLIENQARLSLECRSEVYISIERGAEFNKICKQDIDALCPNIAPGYGRIYSCLILQVSHVSPRCKSRLGTVAQL